MRAPQRSRRKPITRLFASTLLGALLCGVLSTAVFVLAALADGTRAEEAFTYGLIVGGMSALIGGGIGLVIGAADLGMVGGGIVGLLAAATVVAFYVLSFGRPDRYGYFLRESVVLWGLALPTTLSGVITARLTRNM